MLKLFQKLAVVAMAFVLCGCSTTPGTSSNNPQYNYVELLPPSGTFKNSYFQFSYSPPSTTYATTSWEHYEGKNGKRATTLLKGSGLYDSYAVNIEYKGTVAPQMTPVQAASQMHKTLEFSQYDGNPACASTSLNKPVVISPSFAGHMAVCIDKTSNSLYEVSITWRSMSFPVPSFDQLLRDSESCKYEKTLSEKAKCSDRISMLVSSYNQLLSTFQFPGQNLVAREAPAEEPPQAKIYRDESNSFVVKLPTMPTIESGSQNNATSKEYRVGNSRYALSIMVADRAGNETSTSDDRETLAKNAAATRLALSRTSAVDMSPVANGRYVGRLIDGVADGHRLRARIFVTKSHVFSVVAIHRPDNQAAEILADKFFDSFEITE